MLRTAVAEPSRRTSAAEECLTEERVLAFVEGRLDRLELVPVDAHLNTCASCGQLVIEAVHIGRDPERLDPSATGVAPSSATALPTHAHPGDATQGARA